MKPKHPVPKKKGPSLGALLQLRGIANGSVRATKRQRLFAENLIRLFNEAATAVPSKALAEGFPAWLVTYRARDGVWKWVVEPTRVRARCLRNCFAKSAKCGPIKRVRIFGAVIPEASQ